MRILAILAIAALGASGAPAFAQSIMKDFTWADMRAVIEAAGATVTREDIADEQRYLVGKDDSGLVFAVYGFQCDNKETYQRCTGADFVSSFTLKDPGAIDGILDSVNYAALADYKGDDGRLKIARYVIFDNGITRENLQVNAEVFLRLSNDIWDKLDDEGKLN